MNGHTEKMVDDTNLDPAWGLILSVYGDHSEGIHLITNIHVSFRSWVCLCHCVCHDLCNFRNPTAQGFFQRAFQDLLIAPGPDRDPWPRCCSRSTGPPSSPTGSLALFCRVSFRWKFCLFLVVQKWLGGIYWEMFYPLRMKRFGGEAVNFGQKFC